VMATLVVVIVALVLPFTPLGAILGFSPLPVSFLVSIAMIVVAYIATAEAVKIGFYRKVRF